MANCAWKSTLDLNAARMHALWTTALYWLWFSADDVGVGQSTEYICRARWFETLEHGPLDGVLLAVSVLCTVLRVSPAVVGSGR